MRAATSISLIALLLLVAATSVTGGRARAQDEGGAIRGVVYHDLDGDGVRDPNEPGLPAREVTLEPGAAREVTDADGKYSFDAGAGEYTVNVIQDQVSRPCLGPPTDVFSFDPVFFLSYECLDITNPWDTTTPGSVAVTLAAGATQPIDFGLQPVDVVTMAGYAILEDDFAPPGTVIQALFEGTECGRTTAREPDAFGMQLEVYGAGARPGCPTSGDLVDFLVGGVSTGSEVRWVPFTDPAANDGYLNIGLVAIEQHAWYWTQSVVDVPPPDGTAVQAVVGDTVCGEASTKAVPMGLGSAQHLVGFSRLIVPSDDIQPGCGRPDATVSFHMDGEEVGTVPWQPGLQQVSLDLGEALTSTPVLPNNGHGPAPAAGGAGVLIAVLTAFGAGVLLAATAVRRWRRSRRPRPRTCL